jgi:RNA polymerase sigma-70 factor, ECF subfamily
MMDDDELIAAVAAGDDTALRELFTRHAPWLAARLRAALPPSDVEDVLQETFLAVWREARAPTGRRGRRGPGCG